MWEEYIISSIMSIMFPLIHTSSDLHPCLRTARLSSSIHKHPSSTKSSRRFKFKIDGKHLVVICTTEKYSKEDKIRFWHSTYEVLYLQQNKSSFTTIKNNQLKPDAEVSKFIRKTRFICDAILQCYVEYQI